MRESLAIDTIRSRSGDYKEFVTKYGPCEKHWNGFHEINEQPMALKKTPDSERLDNCDADVTSDQIPSMWEGEGCRNVDPSGT